MKHHCEDQKNTVQCVIFEIKHCTMCNQNQNTVILIHYTFMRVGPISGSRSPSTWTHSQTHHKFLTPRDTTLFEFYDFYYKHQYYPPGHLDRLLHNDSASTKRLWPTGPFHVPVCQWHTVQTAGAPCASYRHHTWQCDLQLGKVNCVSALRNSTALKKIEAQVSFLT